MAPGAHSACDPKPSLLCPQDCVGYEDAPLGMQAIKAAGFLKVRLFEFFGCWVPCKAVCGGDALPAGGPCCCRIPCAGAAADVLPAQLQAVDVTVMDGYPRLVA